KSCRPPWICWRAVRRSSSTPRKRQGSASASPSSNRQHDDFTRVLPGGFDVVFDGIGENGYRRSFAALKRRGLLCAYGYTAGVQARRRLVTMLMWIARVYLWRRLLSW